MILVNIRSDVESHCCGDQIDKLEVIISLTTTVSTQTLL